MDAQEAKDALDQISVTKDAISERSKAPTGYYSALGLGLWLDIVAVVLPLPWEFLVLVVALAIIIVTVSWYSRVVGTWSMGNIRGKDSWAFWIMMIVAVAAFLATVILDSLQIAAISGGIVFVVFSILGPIWDRAYQQQVRDR